MKVIAVAENVFIGGSRRRLGSEFEIDPDDFTSYDGELRLPSCLVPASDRARANKIIAQLKAKPAAAARASAGKGAKIQTSGRTA
jgi:hypothetical protein